MRKPNKFDTVLGWLSLCIPAAIVARLVRRITGIKGLPLERACMSYYYNLERKLLGAKDVKRAF